MAVMSREAWTDERLDDLNARVEKGFDEVKEEISGLRAETKAEFGQLRAEMKAESGQLRMEMNSRFNSIDARFDSLQRTMVLGVVSMSATTVGALLVIQL